MSSLKIPVDEDVVQSVQPNEPEHFLLKVESFSLLSDSKMEKYESDEFEADGHKWRLILYPKGDKKRNGDNHISLYLSISDTKSLPEGWEVKARFTLFVYNNISDKYLSFQVANTSTRSGKRFHSLKSEWGFPQLLDLEFFKESSNGYLFNDMCVFGAEISVISTSVVPKRRCLSMMKQTKDKIFSWKIDNFSAIKEECIYSDIFRIGGLQWKLRLYPKGSSKGKGNYISLSIILVDNEKKTVNANLKAYAEYKLRIRNQVNSNHEEVEDSDWFKYPVMSFCFHTFMPLTTLNRKTSGFVVNDTLVVEAEFTVVAMSKDFK